MPAFFFLNLSHDIIVVFPFRVRAFCLLRHLRIDVHKRTRVKPRTATVGQVVREAVLCEALLPCLHLLVVRQLRNLAQH